MSLGKRIASLRKASDMTQEQLAALVGTTRQAVSKWESGKSAPDVDGLVRIGSIFHVSMDYLILGEESTAPDQNKDRSNLQKPQRYWIIYYSVLLSVGISILLLLPLIASAYKNIAPWPKFTDANVYLHEWPLLGVVILGIAATFVGCCGIIWPYRKRIKQQLESFFG